MSKTGSSRIALLGHSRAELMSLLSERGVAAAHARRIWRGLYCDGVTSIDEIDDLPPCIRHLLQDEAVLTLPTAVREQASSDSMTRKYLLRLSDGQQVETVLMQYAGRTTACVSSQVGCALGCVFCATGQMGFGRNLRTEEIVAQALHVAREARKLGTKLSNVVLMGMGEPLLNYDAVLRAIEIVQHPAGLAIAAKRTTLSTVGVPSGIRKLADEGRNLSLAVSLHAATQASREAIVPAARTWPLEELIAACRYFTSITKRRIFFEWTLIRGVNDGAENARQLATLLRGLAAQVNIIPLNATEGYLAAAADESDLHRFRETLLELGVRCSVRQHRGIDIAAGCGQLAAVS